MLAAALTFVPLTFALMVLMLMVSLRMG